MHHPYNYKELSKDCWSYLEDSNPLKEEIQWMTASFHYRNAKSNPDGSKGEIKISPLELLDLLAFVIIKNKTLNEEGITNV